MATILDLGLLEYFGLLFPFLLLLIVTYAVLQKTKVLSGEPNINAIIAFAVAFLGVMSNSVVSIVSFIAPWFTVMILFLILLLLLFAVMGVSEKDFLSAARNNKGIQWSIIGVALIILIAGFAATVGQEFLDAGSQQGELSDFEQNTFDIFVNTKVLGMLLLFGISVFTVALLTGN